MDSSSIWNVPWTTDDFIENSENWSLAGDVALLNTIKTFSDNLLNKTENISHNINNLVNNLEEVGLLLDLSQNEFQSLKNTQFIESRVYDDDETLDSKEIEALHKDENTEKSEEQDVDVTLTSEMHLLDKYYDMVEISVSDSEDETERSFVLKPKDLYEYRPLPPLIGSDEWYKNWYIEDEFSDDDSQKSSEIYSDSDDNLPKDLLNGSETSSDIDFSHTADEHGLAANSTFKNKKSDSIVSSTESEDTHSLPAKVISDKSFAENLAAKLDRVMNNDEYLGAEINTKPIQPPKLDAFSDGLFSDEPPPLSDSKDKTVKGIFSGGRNLFDDDGDNDDEEDSLFEKDDNKGSMPVDKNDDIKVPVNKQDILPQSSKVSKGLFDSDKSDDDDLFISKKPNINNNPRFFQQNKPVLPLFDDEPPPTLNKRTESTEPAKKKPVGGVSVFGDTNIGDILKNTQQKNHVNKSEEISSTSNKKINLFDEEDEVKAFPSIDTSPKFIHKNTANDVINNNNKKDETSKNEATKKSNILRLFDDDDDSNDYDIFADVKKRSSNNKLNLFEDTDDENQNKITTNNDSKSNLFGIKDLKDNKNIKSTGLFDSDEDFENEPDEIVRTKANDPNLKITIPSKNNQHDELFSGILKGETNDLLNESSRIREDDKLVSKNIKVKDENLFTNHGSNIFSDDSKTKSKKINLFDNDDNDDEDDLFANVKKLDFESVEDFKNIPIQKPKDLIENAEVKAEINKTSNKNVVNKVQILDVDESGKSAEEQLKSSLDEDLQSTKNQSKSSLDEDLQNMKEPSLAFPPVVSLFGSSPPSDDDGLWDTKSDIFSDTEDFISYQNDESCRPQHSILFDNEPPSLNENEASSILTDNNNKRFDTVESSFNPYANSSRRVATDIFSDQQSEDGFFVTKNKTDFNSDSTTKTNCSNLDIITQDSRMTTIDVTPSGTLEETVKEDFKNENLDIAIDTGILTDLEIKQNKTDEDANDNSDKEKTSSTEKEKPTKKREENREKSIKKIASITEMLKNQKSSHVSSEKKASPGKLKPTLNINVNALLPGMTQPKIKSLTKSEQSKDENNKENKLKNDAPISPSIEINDSKEIPHLQTEKPLGFDVTDSINVLPSITKERVRNPAKRRPSTRRARQDAIRASLIENTEEPIIPDVPEKDRIIPDVPTSVQPPEDKSPELTLPTSSTEIQTDDISTEDTDKLNIEKEPENKNPHKLNIEKEPENKNPPKRNLFSSDSESEQESDLFTSTNLKKTEDKNIQPKLTILSDDESFQQLVHSDNDNKLKSKTATKKSLFDDSSSEDDGLFTGSNNKSKNKTEKVSKIVKKKTSNVKKLENTEAMDDPLLNLLK